VTVLDLLKSSLRAIQVLAPGRTPGPSETTDALTVLNAMLRSWATNRLIVHAIARAEYSVPAQASYTIGPDGDIDATRPVKIQAAARLSNGEEIPLELFEYTASPSRAGLYYNASWPLGTLRIHPAPVEGLTLVLYTQEVFSEITDTEDDVEFPPGYEDAIRYNLAVRLAPEWGRVASPLVIDFARTSLAAIQSLNLPKPDLSIDLALFPTGGFNRGGFEL
jgi:hypothetical protein